METIRVGDETTVIPFDIGTTTAVAVTVFSLGLELSANDIRKEDHLKDFPGASLIIVETSEVCIFAFITLIITFLHFCRKTKTGPNNHSRQSQHKLHDESIRTQTKYK